MTKIAVVHDYFIQMGGAERVAEELHSIFPGSQMFTTVDLRQGGDAKTSWMQRLPITEANHRLLFLVYPFAVNSLDLSDFDLIISSTSGYAKGVKKKKGALHICYCHTPMRWVWRYEDYAAREQFGRVGRLLLPRLLSGLKKWDLQAAQRPDLYIANSEVTARRIKTFYNRDSVVIPPPIDVDRFSFDESDEGYYLLLSRLLPYKRLDLAVEACRQLDRPLVVIGDGPARKSLEQISGPKTKFLGRQPDDVVARYAGRCRALIFPGEEDFGMTPLEINAAGRPVIAYGSGGARETVIDGETGVFFELQTPKNLIEAMTRFESMVWDRQTLRRQAEKFGRDVFASRIHELVEGVATAALADEVYDILLRPSLTVQKNTA
jgi:glycosyltransferase involved in cell wall biosynthesis